MPRCSKLINPRESCISGMKARTEIEQENNVPNSDVYLEVSDL